MLRISKLTDYGTVVMLYFARVDCLANAKAIAQDTRISLPTVSKILKLLLRAGLLCSVRGVNGGYHLARPASTISIAEILLALEDKPGFTECAQHEGHCSFESFCSMKTHWKVINHAVESVLRSIFLADLVSPSMQPTTVIPTIQWRQVLGEIGE
jgi:FeS assembly SUF system regulator